MRLRVIAYAKKPVGAVMMRPILQRMAVDPRFELWGCADRFGRAADPQAMFAAAGVTGLRPTRKWLARLRRCDIYLSADFGVVARRARLKVHVFHGVSFRNHAVNSAALRYDLLLLAGPYMLRRFEELGLADAANRERFAVVGVPKLDRLVDGTLQRDAVLRQLGLDPRRRTLLYAPTWSKKVSSLENHGEALLRALAQVDAQVLVKLHDNSFDPRKASRDWRTAVRALAGDGRVRLMEQADVVPLMAAADLLVSDASSVANEFTLLDRPLVFVDVPALPSRLKPKADLDTWGRKAGFLASGPHDLVEVIETAFDRPRQHAEVRRALAADLFATPGRATDAAMTAIDAALSRC